MQYGLDVSIAGEYAQVSLLAELAALAEDSGWDGFFVQDGLLNALPEPLVDPWMALCAIALRTRHVRIGALMTPLAAYLPWQVARQTVSLDHLSEGRLIFGAGLGFQPDDFAKVGEDADPRQRAAKLDAGLEILQLLWSGQAVTFQGAHYRMTGARLLPKPRQLPRIPIWIACQWPHLRPLRRAVRFDGVYLASQKAGGDPLAPPDIREALAFVHTQRTATSPFAVAFAGQTPADTPAAASIVEPYTAAGVTWWLEGIWSERGTLAKMKDRIRAGPPRLPA